MTYQLDGWMEVLLPFAAEEPDQEVVESVLGWVDAVADDPHSVVYEPVPGRNARVSPVPGTSWTITWSVFDAPVKIVRLIKIGQRRSRDEL